MPTRIRISLLCLLTFATCTSVPRGARAPASVTMVPTRVIVRVLAHDAKLLQDPVGGARVSIRDAERGTLLASGQLTGKSGDTKKIMLAPHVRGERIYDTPGAGAFEAVIPLAHPTRVEIVTEGPLKFPQAVQRASTTLLLVPGKDVLGDGVVLELHGLIVEIEKPAADSTAGPASLNVRATVRMMCGCPLEPGGIWDADRVEVMARIVDHNGTLMDKQRLTYAGTPNTFEGEFRALPPQGSILEVLAMDSDRANFGMDRRIIETGR